ncbi:ABC transporter substrate-binding protein [Streptomyces sp. MP131-18]|uniref:ABC transporter substrate-binding protein n=1 Tax=Streptomyces sp. MP131-18 TaxID=1857892 RepID=UPI00097C2A66|nr:ABC transporter substrate-binding protein [Streptomyces sp. MP131-18]ONK14588.1 putative aliphatic sulfonates-binding protein precursor [Streptomyces sp. MP131-18]
MLPLRRGHVRAALTAATALLLSASAACGPGGGGSGGDPDDLDLGVIPIIDVAPIRLGIEQGFFAEEGLTVTMTESQGGAAIVPAVTSGSLDIGYSNIVSLLLARSQDVPVRMVSVGARASADALDDGSGQLMTADPGLTDVADLRGGTVAVNTLLGINEVAVRTGLTRHGLSGEDVSLVEVPIPNMPAALAAGDVDAAMLSEPFITIAEGQGAHAVPVSYAAMGQGLPIAGWFTSESFAAEHPDVVDRFATALERSLRYAEEHPDEARAVLDDYLDLAEGVSARVTLPGWDPRTDAAELEDLARLTAEAGLIENTDPLDGLLAP